MPDIRRTILTILWSLVVLVLAASGAPVMAQAPQPVGWVQVGTDTTKQTFVLARDKGCEWSSSGIFQVTIGPSGDCGRDPTNTNYFFIYGHNPECDLILLPGLPRMCHYSKMLPGIMQWAALLPGDAITLSFKGAFYRGTVLQAIHEANKLGIGPDDPFPCPEYFICGSLITSADIVPAYVKVEFAVQLIRGIGER